MKKHLQKPYLKNKGQSMGLKTIKLPDLGEGVTEGEIVGIKVSEGETISMDQILLEVMTDKASMEVPSSIEGTVEKIVAKEGDILSVGAPILTLKTTENEDETQKPEVLKNLKAKDTKTELKTQETKSQTKELEEATKAQGPEAQKELKSVELETKSQTKELETKLEKTKIKLKTTQKPETLAPKSPAKPLTKQFSFLAIPSTRQLAKELDVPLQHVKGSGPQGEIKREDLIKHIKSGLKAQSEPASPLQKPALSKNLQTEQNQKEKHEKQASSLQNRETKKQIGIEGDKADLHIAALKTEELKLKAHEILKIEPLRGIKRLMFNSMTLSKATIPHFTIGEQVNVEHIMNVRQEIKTRLEKQGLKTGWLAFFIKALIPCLKEFPIFNSVYDPKNKQIFYKKDMNIGFAVDSPKGLLVPVLKQAQNKSLLELIKQTQKLAKQARQGDIQRENLTGASITLSNLGSLGGLYGTPIINPPEMAIIGIYSLFWQAVRNSKTREFEEKPFINFSITCDHRFIDGATAVRFLKSWTNKIQEPSLLLLD